MGKPKKKLDSVKCIKKELRKEKRVRLRKQKLSILGRGNGCKFMNEAKKKRKGLALESDSAVGQDLISELPAQYCDNPVSIQETLDTANFETSTDITSKLQSQLDLTKKTFGSVKKVTEVKNVIGDWGKRVSKIENEWANFRPKLQENIVASLALYKQKCQSCHNADAAVRCIDCRFHLCIECDRNTHTKILFHDRVYTVGKCNRFLNQDEFFSVEGKILKIDVSVPCFVPPVCGQCEFTDLKCVPGYRNVAVVTTKGRFDVKSTEFECSNCGAKTESRTADYIVSGFWPGTADNDSSYLFCGNLLLYWYHLQHKIPGTSQRKFLETLGDVSEKHNRCSTISPMHFEMASKEFEFSNYHIEANIKRINNMECKACGTDPLACHCDANMKCYRLESANDHGSTPLFEGIAIAKDDEVNEFVADVNSEIPVLKGHGTCGSSTFKAGKTDSTYYKGLDETGIVSLCCRHGVILKATNMYQGETYRLIAFLHSFALKLGILFFCYDVICRYWKFVQKLGRLRSKYLNLTSKMEPFLSRFHGKAHSWVCQVLWFGHWRKKSAATLGEEQEQVFAKISRYACTTKHMTKSNRIDTLTKGFLYHNAQKEKKMVSMLTKRLHTARKQIPKLSGKLESMLKDRKLVITDLSSIREKLESQAKLVKEPRLTNKWPLENMQKELEGICVVMKNLRDREMRFADGCKARTVFRRKMTNLKARACDLMKFINEKSEWNITEENRISGIFPWQTSGYTSVADDFQLIDTWELHKRFEEEEYQTKLEMISFISKTCEGVKILEEDVEKLSNKLDALSQGKAILKNAEISRLKLMLNDALFSFDVDFELDEEVLLEMEHEEEEIALQRMFDEEEFNDIYDHSEMDENVSE